MQSMSLIGAVLGLLEKLRCFY